MPSKLITNRENRIDILDALRGIAVIMMVLHHITYDLTSLQVSPEALFENPVVDALHYVSSTLFISLCGVSSNYSRSNLTRGLKTAVIALIITAVTFLVQTPVIFGVLHMLSFCMIFCGLTEKLWRRLPRLPMLIFNALMIPASAAAVNLITIDSRYLWMFGWTYPGFYSSDYFPLLPWFFVFFTGVYLGGYVRDRRLPERFYTLRVPFFPTAGKYALPIYVAHQPLIYGIVYLIKIAS